MSAYGRGVNRGELLVDGGAHAGSLQRARTHESAKARTYDSDPRRRRRVASLRIAHQYGLGAVLAQRALDYDDAQRVAIPTSANIIIE